MIYNCPDLEDAIEDGRLRNKQLKSVNIPRPRKAAGSGRCGNGRVGPFRRLAVPMVNSSWARLPSSANVCGPISVIGGDMCRQR